ncbi:unnamed protein product [Mortierella alpina]
MSVVVCKFGPTEFQELPEFSTCVDTLAADQIRINMFAGADNSTCQVVHGKAIVIDDHVLFSTGSLMDTWSDNEADFSIELPAAAAAAFWKPTAFVDEAAEFMAVKMLDEVDMLVVFCSGSIADQCRGEGE